MAHSAPCSLELYHFHFLTAKTSFLFSAIDTRCCFCAESIGQPKLSTRFISFIPFFFKIDWRRLGSAAFFLSSRRRKACISSACWSQSSTSSASFCMYSSMDVLIRASLERLRIIIQIQSGAVGDLFIFLLCKLFVFIL